MEKHAIEMEIAEADKAINTKNFESLMDSYTEDAALVVTPDTIVNGRGNIKNAYKSISEYFNGSLTVSQGDRVIIEAGDTALVLSKTFIDAPGKPDSEYTKERDAVYVYKKDLNGKWRCIIDNSYGVELLNR